MSLNPSPNFNPSKGFFQWRSITTRLTLFYLLILVSGIWIVSAIGNYFLKQDLQRVSGEQQFSTATLMAAHINQEVISLVNNMQVVAIKLHPTLLADSSALRNMLETNVNLQLSFNEGVFVTDLNSEVIASTSKMVPRVDTSFMNSALLQTAEKQNKSSIIEIATDTRLGLPVIRVIIPLRDKQDKVFGALLGVVNLSLPNFLTLLSNNRYGKTGGYFLSSPTIRVIIAATDKARIMEKFPAPGINADIDYFLSGGQGTRVMRNALGVEVLASVVQVPLPGWVLAMSLPTEEAFALLYALQTRLLLSAVFLTILSSALTWWMLQRQLAGLALANDAVLAQSKDLDVAHLLPVTDDDEIGELVGGFNHLLALLRERDTALIWSEKRFRAIFNAEPECVKLVAENGDLLEMNAAGLNMLEASTLEQVRERGLEWFILPEYRIKNAQLLAQVMSGTPGNLEFEIEGLQGTRRWLESNAMPLKNTEDGSTMMLSVTRDITEQKQLQETLQTALKEKTILLNEVHHRVKNNLQVITSLLSLESARSNNSATQAVLKSMQGRIRSMALLHQSLYRSGIVASTDLGAYLQELASQSFRAQANQGSSVRLKLDLERIMVSMDQAAPCGLLANELIANSFKHAFPDAGEGEINLALRALPGTDKVRLSVSDSGVGLPTDFAARRENSLGLQLVADLARQIGGALEITAGPTAQFIVDFIPDLQRIESAKSIK